MQLQGTVKTPTYTQILKARAGENTLVPCWNFMEIEKANGGKLDLHSAVA